MLDISFYSDDKKIVDTVSLSEGFYLWLSKSDFSKIGKSEEKEMKADEEVVKVPVVFLEGENRRKFSTFFRDAIVQESNEMLDKLGSSPSMKEYSDYSYKLKTLHDILKLVENEKNKYLGRVE